MWRRERLSRGSRALGQQGVMMNATSDHRIELPTPYLIFLADANDPIIAKTAIGVRDWAPEKCVGQWRSPECTLDLQLPNMNPAAALAAGARSLLIGLSPFGGALPAPWIPSLVEALEAGLDLVSGLHVRLSDVSELRLAAERTGRCMFDVRHPRQSFVVGTGAKRPGKRLLTVGTDCALGKKYTALAIARALEGSGRSVDFRATGQTGIMISGAGVAMDVVVSDFLAGAAEALSPAAPDDHWDIIEGQGSLYHPAYAGVTLGLLHGSQPDAVVLCHHPLRKHIHGYASYPIPDPADAVELYLQLARLTNPAVKCVGLSLNTFGIAEEDRCVLMDQYREKMDVPVFDPVRDGVDDVLRRIDVR